MYTSMQYGKSTNKSKTWYDVIGEISAFFTLFYLCISGTFYWYEISRDMDCESVFPVYVLYSKGKLSSFGLTLKGHVNSQIFDHPNPSLAFVSSSFVSHPLIFSCFIANFVNFILSAQLGCLFALDFINS